MARNKSASVKNGPKKMVGILREQIAYLLKGGGAHVHFEDSLAGLPANKRGAYAKGMPHTAWQLLEHMRLAQWDIVQYCVNPKHVSPDFPEGYWPKSPSPSDDAAWEKGMSGFKKDLKEMVRLIENPRTNLFAPIGPGRNESILREALLLADHNSYHLGQILCLRKALHTWPEE